MTQDEKKTEKSQPASLTDSQNEHITISEFRLAITLGSGLLDSDAGSADNFVSTNCKLATEIGARKASNFVSTDCKLATEIGARKASGAAILRSA